MTAQEFVSFLERYIADKTPNFGDGDSVLTLLYEAYNDANNMDSDDIKAGFHELYQAMNGMPLRKMDTIVNPVCTLCRDYEQAAHLSHAGSQFMIAVSQSHGKENVYGIHRTKI